MRRAVFPGYFLRLQADLQQQGLGVPGAARQLHGDAERFPRRRPGVVIPEIVDHFLNADCVRRRDLALQNHTPQLGVGGRIHIRGKGGQRRG